MSRAYWLLGLAAFLVTASPAEAQRGRRGGDVPVGGYTRRDGTYVPPHMRSRPDGNPYNNWSTRGNVNPYTGKPGTKSPDGTSSRAGRYGGGTGEKGTATEEKRRGAEGKRPEDAGRQAEGERPRDKPERAEKEPADRAEAVAAASLSLIKQLIDAGKLQGYVARVRLERFIREYPDTVAAEEAELLLKKLTK